MARLLCLLLWVCATTAQADEALWQLLRGGGQVLFVRHATTTPGAGDPPGFRLADCATQRNLSDEGRAQARKLGEALRAQHVPVGQVLSSPWCRCHDTAELAFGRRAETWEPLSNLFGRTENAGQQVEALKRRIGAYRGKENLVLVSHGSTVLALTGVSPQPGEIVVLTPLGGTELRIAGKLSMPR